MDVPIPSLSATPPCSLPDVLNLAASRAGELVGHLQNFDAQEQVRYDQTDVRGFTETNTAAGFDYLVDFERPSGGVRVHETRTPLPGTGRDLSVDMVDTGLPTLALIFHPTLRSDYEMRCEGLARWNNQLAWVVYFQQLKNKRPRTVAVASAMQYYPIGLKGRAWIAAGTGEVIHLETNLLKPIVMMCNCTKGEIVLRANALSVDYAPVKFQSRNVEIWLPQSTVAYSDYEDHRVIIEHTFSNFKLFSVQTQTVIGKPQE